MKKLFILLICLVMILVIGIMLLPHISPEIITFTVICGIVTIWFLKEIK